MTPPRPTRQVCPICGHDDDVEILLAGDEWVTTCSSRGHLPFEWRAKEQFTEPLSHRTGIGEELGVYDDLLACVRERSNAMAVKAKIAGTIRRRALPTPSTALRRSGRSMSPVTRPCEGVTRPAPPAFSD